MKERHKGLLSGLSSALVLALIAVVTLVPAQRTHAAGYVVDTVVDNHNLTACTAADNDCSLRGAVSRAAAPGADTITFDASDFNPGAPATIVLTEGVLSVSATSTTIDGSSAGVIIKGNGEPAAASCISIPSGSSIVIKNVSITDCANGISVSGTASNILIGPGNVIYDNTDGIDVSAADAGGYFVEGNFIGTDSTGAAVHPDGGNATGVHIAGGANVTIGGTSPAERNIISSNADGVVIDGSSPGDLSEVAIVGNYIGLDATGAADLGNTGDGVRISGNNVTYNDIESNVISGNGGDGIDLATADNNGVRNNKVGTNAAGTAAIGNGLAGVRVSGNNNVIGGSAVTRNLISGNADGVIIEGGGSLNDVLGNRIGTNEGGTAAIPNADDGVEIINASTNFIGLAGNGNLISGNGGDGVRITGTSSANDVFANYIGTNLAGTGTIPNGSDGIQVAASNNAIGDDLSGRGNVISGNAVHGIRISTGASGVTVQGNLIGTNAAGTVDLGNNNRGIQIEGDSASNYIGGTTTLSRNVISGNNAHGIDITGTLSGANEIKNNYIGTNSAGDAAIGNSLAGVRVNASPGTIIGDSAAGAGNVISGNGTDGIVLTGGSGTHHTWIGGNLIGTSASGDVALGNGGHGMLISGVAENTVGGALAGEQNVISGNANDGIRMQLAGSTLNQVLGNAIGTDATETLDLGNGGDGIEVSTGSGNTIGGSAGAGNVIRNNGGDGVFIPTGTGNAVLENIIADNGGLGIDLGTNGVTANDAAPDSDAGANNLQNFPVLSGVTSASNITNIVGTLSSAANTQFTVRYYHSPACDASGNGEGALHFATGTVTTNGSGVGNINSVFALRIPTLSWVTATATDPAGNTSEFSACTQVPPILVDTNSDANLTTCTSAPADCTLRGAINRANTYDDFDVIHFAIGSGAVEISPATALPAITQAVLIDGSTQPGFAGAPLVTLEGDSAGDISGLTVNAGSGSTVRGLLIRSFNLHGIVLASSNNVIEGNFVGTDGSASYGNGSSGIRVLGNASGNRIGGDSPAERNVISGNDVAGVTISGLFASGNTVSGNYIGTDAAGTTGIPNGIDGIQIQSAASGNHIGGIGSGEGNVISGNAVGSGVALGPGTTATRIYGNSIGLNASRSSAVGNALGIAVVDSDSNLIGSSELGGRNVISGNGTTGVLITGGSTGNTLVNNIVGLDGSGAVAIGNGEDGVTLSDSSNNTIGGPDSAERNIISGNLASGVSVSGATAANNVIRGNYVGSDLPGSAARPNGLFGVQVTDTPGTVVGGAAPGEGNLLSGNAYSGVLVDGSSSGTQIQGNKIGTAANGTTPLGNSQNGVNISASGTTVSDNTVAYNNTSGVRVQAGTGNRIEGNSIHSNGGLGIDVGAVGVTPNDGGTPPDQDAGPNNLLNFPVISLVTSDFTFYGSLVSSPSTTLTLHAYHSAACDTSGHGEGQTPMTSFSVVTNAQGYAQFLASKGSAPLGSFVTATVMDTAGNTSEFSPCVEIRADWDGDAVPDAADNCDAWPNPAQSLPAWAIPTNDPDCDGFSTLIETFVGTDPSRQCPNTATANDEAVDAWPSDFNDSRLTNLADVVLMGASYNQSQGQAGYNQRFDLNASGSVSLADVVLMGPFYNRSCT